MNIVLEIFLLSFIGGEFSHKVVYENVEHTSVSPDELVWQVAAKVGYDAQNHFRHSTSWRYENERKEIVLTYIVFEEGIKLPDATKTSIDNIDNPVLGHALRHFKFLIDQDGQIASPEVRQLLANLKPDLAGEINLS